MNCVRELRLKKGIQQKELAIEIGVSSATVSDWEHQRKNPRGENLKKLAEYFSVDEQFILGYGMEDPNLFIPENPKTSGVSETDQILGHILQRLEGYPRTEEARLISTGVDAMPPEQREKALNLFNLVFANFIKKGTDKDET